MEDKKKDELAQISVDRFLSSGEAKKYGLSSNERFVLLALANRAGKNSKCWPSQKFLSEYMNLCLKTITTLISSLESKNLIKIEREGKFNYYTLTLPSSVTITRDQEKDTCNHYTYEPSSSVTVTPMNQVQVQPLHPNISIKANNSFEPNNSLMFTDVNVSKIFEQFWECYPRKQNKNKARKLWRNKNLDKQIDLIVADINKRKQEDHQWKSKQFIPLATTYLNGERWNDEIIKQEQKKPNESSYVKNEIRSTVQEWNPEKLQQVKTEEEIKKSDVVRESHMAKINKLIGRRK